MEIRLESCANLGDLPITHYATFPAPFFSEDLLHDIWIFTDVKAIDLVISRLISRQRIPPELQVQMNENGNNEP